MSPTEKKAVIEHLHTEIATLRGPFTPAAITPVERALTDVDVRQPDAEDTGHLGMIEVATFCEGEYIESVYIDRERATELRDQLTALLSWAGPPTPLSPEGWYQCRTCGCWMDADDKDEATEQCCGSEP